MKREVHERAGNGLAHFYFCRPMWQRGAMVGLLTFAVGLSLATIAHLLLDWRWFSEALFKNTIEGVVIGYVAYALAYLREKRLERRMKEIGYLNHHIRNALQVIEFAAYQVKESKEIFDTVYGGVRRICDTLAKVQRASDVESADDLDLDKEQNNTQQ